MALQFHGIEESLQKVYNTISERRTRLLCLIFIKYMLTVSGGEIGCSSKLGEGSTFGKSEYVVNKIIPLIIQKASSSKSAAQNTRPSKTN
jgi:hypothetical protein